MPQPAALKIVKIALYDVRDLPAGATIIASDGGIGWHSYLAMQVAPRYGEGSSQPYGRIWVRPARDPEGEVQAWFAPWGTLYMVAVPEGDAQLIDI